MKAIDIVLPPAKTEQDEWLRWINYMQGKGQVLNPRRKAIEVK